MRRWYCAPCHRTFSALPDCLACGVSGSLEEIEEVAAVAESSGKMAAVRFAHYIFHPHCRHIEDVCYLQDLFTDHACRGQGIGRALMEGVFEAADNSGAPSVYWITHDSNESAQALYNRIGELTPFIKYRRR